MKSTRTMMLGCLLAASALTATGCVEEDASLLMWGHIIQTGTEDEAGEVTCEIPAGEGDASLISGHLFVDLAEIEADGQAPASDPGIFYANLALVNRLGESGELNPIGNDQNLRIDQNWVELSGLEFEFEPAAFEALNGTYDFTALVPSGDGFLHAAVPLIQPADLIQRWRPAFQAASNGQANAIVPALVTIKAVGETLGGEDVESNAITLPIDICDGCGQASTPYCQLEAGG